jgi:transposase
MLSDKGYYKGEDIQAGEEAGIDAYVARPQRGSAVSHRLFRKEEFRYDPGSDTYLCPGAQRLEPRYHSEVKGHALVNYPAGATIMRRKAVRVERRRRLGRG